MAWQVSDDGEDGNPLDLVEHIVEANAWPFERQCAEELSVCISGAWCDYQLGFSLSERRESLQLACAYDAKVPRNRMPAVHALLAMINERMWLGHFDLWTCEALPMFRHGVLLRGGLGPSADQLEELISIAVGECERYYPAFQFVIWGGKAPQDAMAAAMLETVGEA